MCETGPRPVGTRPARNPTQDSSCGECKPMLQPCYREADRPLTAGSHLPVVVPVQLPEELEVRARSYEMLRVRLVS